MAHQNLSGTGPGLLTRDLPSPAAPPAAPSGPAQSPRPGRPRAPPATPTSSSAPGPRRPGSVHADGFAWVKYGEKKLTPSRLVREYYKCKNWREPGAGGTACRARKIVDRASEEDAGEEGRGAGAAETEGESGRGGRKVPRAVFPRHCPSQSPEYSRHNHDAPAPATPRTPSPDAAAAAVGQPWVSFPCGGLPPLPAGASLPGPCTPVPHSAAASDGLGLEGPGCYRGVTRGAALPRPSPESLLLQQALGLLSQGCPSSMGLNPCPRPGLEVSEASRASGSHSTLLQGSSAGGGLAAPSVPQPLRGSSRSPTGIVQQGLSPRPSELHLLGASAPAPNARSREAAWKRPALTPLVIPEDHPEESRQTQTHSWRAGVQSPGTDLGGVSQAATPAPTAHMDIRRRDAAHAAGIRSSALSLALILAQQQTGAAAGLRWPEPCNNSLLLPLQQQQDGYPGSFKRPRHATTFDATPAPCATAALEGAALLAAALSAASPAPFLQPRTASGDCSCETMDSAAKFGTALPYSSAPALPDVPCKGWADAAICATPTTAQAGEPGYQAVVKQERVDAFKRERGSGTLELADIPDEVLLSLLHAVTDQIVTSSRI